MNREDVLTMTVSRKGSWGGVICVDGENFFYQSHDFTRFREMILNGIGFLLDSKK